MRCVNATQKFTNMSVGISGKTAIFAADVQCFELGLVESKP